MRFDAAIFDMDGLLLESESLWRQAEHEVSSDLGLGFTDADFERTMGVRMRDVAQMWFEWNPWSGPSVDEVAERVVQRVIDLVAGSDLLPGVLSALELVESLGLKVALCSSSDDRLIDAAVKALGIEDRFEVIHSAEHDENGKPHPQPYLSTATKLSVSPRRCLAFEDSVNGCISARAAQMTVIAVPDAAANGSGQFGFADVVLDSLEQFDQTVLDSLSESRAIPNLSRPRFHLAFGVSDLDLARHFYGKVLGCREGRSAQNWIDFDFFGHQIVTHLDSAKSGVAVTTTAVDGQQVPAQHFGALLPLGPWNAVVARLQASEAQFLIEPNVRFEGLAGEQHTCFVLDPSGNALEFKAFADDRQVFAKQ